MSAPRMSGLNRAQRRAIEKSNRRVVGAMVAALDIPDPGRVRDAARDIMRGEAEKALRALEKVVQAAVESTLDDAIGKAVRALNGDGRDLIAAGHPDRVLSLDSLGAIPTEWKANLPTTIDALGQAYGAGAWAVAVRFGAKPEALPAALDTTLDARAVAHLADAGNRMVGVGDDAWATIRSSLVDSTTQGLSFDAMSEAVGKAANLAKARAMTVARTETIRAVNAGQYDTATIMEVSAQKQWLATLDNTTRESHADADGQTVPLADTFTVGSDDLDYPGDPNGSPEETVNCRCTLLFVETEGEVSDENRQYLDDAEAEYGDIAASGQEATMKHRLSIGQGAVTVALDPDSPVDPRAIGASIATALANAVQTRDRLVGHPVLALEDVDVDLATEVIETPDASRPDTPMKQGEDVPDAPPETWHAVLIVEGVPTGDRRLAEPGSLTWRDLPLPIENQILQPPGGGHANAVDVARATRLERQGNEIHAWGYHLTAKPEGSSEPTDGEQWMATLIETGRMGISADMDDADIEIDWPEPDPDADPMEALFGEPDLVRFTRARVMGATCVPFPAFSEAYIEPITAPVAEVPVPPNDTNAIVAAAAPVAPPIAWFDRPAFTGPTGHTVTDEGRVYGHLATWGTCHTSFQGACITPPVEDEAVFFTTSETVTAEGDRVATGRLTMGTGHAVPGLMSADAKAHYDNTGTGVADVACGFDEFGIWYAGALRPHLSAEQVRTFRGSALSGDWRRIGGQLRLVAALAVNTPGFPIPRTQTSVRDGVQIALVASGIVAPVQEFVASGSRHDRAIADRIAASIGRSNDDRRAALRARVHGTTLTEFADCRTCGGHRAVAVPGAKILKSSDDLRAAGRPAVRYEVVSSGGVETFDTLMEARRARKTSNGTIRIR